MLGWIFLSLPVWFFKKEMMWEIILKKVYKLFICLGKEFKGRNICVCVPWLWDIKTFSILGSKCLSKICSFILPPPYSHSSVKILLAWFRCNIPYHTTIVRLETWLPLHSHIIRPPFWGMTLIFYFKWTRGCFG